MPLCEFEKTITCPYNPSHQITEPRMDFHLTKCRKNHGDSAYVVCPFNSLHHIPKPEQRYHMMSCADRKSVELLKFMTEDEKPAARNIHVINEEGEKGEDEDAESNSNPIDALQNDLDAFREQWKKELEASEKNKDGVEKDTEDEVHMKARELFLEAAALEEKGKRDIPDDENCDAETVNFTYNPSAKTVSKLVLGKTEGATPSQRKEFRRQERERLGKLSQGTTQNYVYVDQTQSIPGLETSDNIIGSSQRRDSHMQPWRRPTMVQESVEAMVDIENRLLKLHLGRGGPGKVRDELRRPGVANVGDLRRPRVVEPILQLDVGASKASEDGGSSTTSYSVNDVNANRLITMARGRGLKIIKQKEE